jgi:sulfur-oxidizing protein SoxY
MKHLSRRDTLRLGGITIAALAATPALASPEAEAIVADFTRGRPTKETGLVLDIPLTVENANAMPVEIRLEQDFSASHYCEEFLLIAEKNPWPRVCRFKFSPGMGMANIVTRIRLAESQTIIALARMNDGVVLIQRQAVIVMVGGCNG